jgi:hypothetical protein
MSRVVLMIANSLEIEIVEPSEFIVEEMCPHWALSAVQPACSLWVSINTMQTIQVVCGPGVCYIPILWQIRCCEDDTFEPFIPLPVESDPTPSVSPRPWKTLRQTRARHNHMNHAMKVKHDSV